MIASSKSQSISSQSQNALPIEENLSTSRPKLPFEGSGNLCDILHNKTPTNIRHWLDFYSQNHPMIIKGGYDESYLNFRIACSYILYNSPDREKLYRDLKRIKDLNVQVFDFLEFFNLITNDVAKQEFYTKRFFKQFQYESEQSLKLLGKLAKQYDLNQIIQWIDLFTLVYEESYLSTIDPNENLTAYPKLKTTNFF